MSTTKPTSRFATVADLIRELGVPAARIRMNPPPGTATVKDVVRINERKSGGLCELVDGVLVDKAMGFREGLIAAWLIEALAPFVRRHQLGLVGGADTMLKLRRTLVRLPDVAFVSWDQLPDGDVPSKAAPPLYPDLAIEVISESNRPKEMKRKRREYFRAGSRLVWIVYPKSETVEVYSSPTDFQTFGMGDTLDGGEVLPGLKLPVRHIFTPPNPPARPRAAKKK